MTHWLTGRWFSAVNSRAKWTGELSQFSSRKCRPWDTIRRVPTTAAAGHATSFDSQLDHNHAASENPEVVPDHLRDFAKKPPVTDPVVVNLFQKQNPRVPGMMSPKQALYLLSCQTIGRGLAPRLPRSEGASRERDERDLAELRRNRRPAGTG